MTGQYRTLFTGTLVQDSSLSVGGNNPHAMVDDPLCCDGEGRFTLRGTTLAGALIAMAHKIAPDEDFSQIGNQEVGKDSPPHESLWRVFNSHPANDPDPEFRQSVGIRQDTGASAGGNLFDIEVLPHGTEWPFILEVKTHDKAGLKAEALAAAALMEWTKGHCWIGRNVASGMGWMLLTNLKAHRLIGEHVLFWPDSSSKYEPMELIASLGVEPMPENRFRDKLNAYWPVTSGSWYWLEIEGKAIVGERDDGYGLDGLSIGGHGGGELHAEWDGDHFLKPEGVSGNMWQDSFRPDNSIVMSTKPGGKAEPVIPGSSLRGPLRHELSRFLRELGQEIVDPVATPAIAGDKHNPDEVEQLFGNMDDSSALLIREAFVDGDWKAAWLQQHAEDEFSGGAYESSKFDRMALLKGTFKWKIVIEGKDKETVNTQFVLLQKALTYAEAGHLGLGAQQWRGLGWCKWIVTNISGDGEEQT